MGSYLERLSYGFQIEEHFVIVKPKFPRKIEGDWVTAWPDSGKIYASVCIVKKLLDACSIEYDFVSELKKIMRSVRVEQLESMGFPDDWDKEKLFR